MVVKEKDLTDYKPYRDYGIMVNPYKGTVISAKTHNFIGCSMATYPRVSLKVDGKYKSLSMNHLVWETVNGPLSNDQRIYCIDHDTTNVKIDNLCLSDKRPGYIKTKMKAVILTNKETGEEYTLRSKGALLNHVDLTVGQLNKLIDDHRSFKVYGYRYYVRCEYLPYSIDYDTLPRIKKPSLNNIE